MGQLNTRQIRPQRSSADEAWFHGGTLDGVTSRSNSYRKHQGIPDPNSTYKIRLRWLNGATAPASTTNAILAFVACQDYAELTAEETAMWCSPRPRG